VTTGSRSAGSAVEEPAGTPAARPLRVLQLITRRQRRGAEVFAAELSDLLVERGHRMTIAALYEPAPLPLEPSATPWVDLGGWPGRGLNRETLRAVTRLVARFQPDLVQANGSDTLKYSVLARRITRARWSLVYRNISVVSRWLRNPLHRGWNRWLAHSVDHVVSVSEASRDDFLRTYRLEPGRITTIPRAVRIPERVDALGARQRLKELTGMPATAMLLVHVGSFTPEKNHLWLLDAFRRIRERCPHAHLALLGDGPLRPRVEQAVAAGGLAASVHLLGARADASELVAAADVFVLPSLVEGIPGALVEAAAQAVPAVANDVGGVRQALHDGETGVLAQPGDLDGFVGAVTRLLHDPAVRREMGRRARGLARREFDLAAIAGRYEDLYLRLRGEPAAEPHPQ
jgi:glycosyltransferase involved in cell wall biosynthesis